MKAVLAVVLIGCSASGDALPPDAAAHDAPPDSTRDATSDTSATGFGEISGMCGVLTDTELLGTSASLVADVMTFSRVYVDPTDRGLLTPGGMILIDTPNAGGSSELSELFAFEQLARCEGASLVKTETQIVYTNMMGKKTDILVMIDGHKIGVSVTRAFAYPIGSPYSEQQATTLLTDKLSDIQLSSANVSAADAWEKQILAYQAIDDQTEQMLTTVWNGLAADVKADTILLVTRTDGADLFLYQNQN